MSMRITDNVAITKSTEMAADRIRDIRQTGLSAGTIHEINQDTEEDLHTVRDKSEVEGAIVRTDSESGNKADQEQKKREKKEAPPGEEGGELQRRASERLLNLPVSSGKDAEVETKRFDIRV
ncbi:MAG: hypothetical protein LBI19_01230 [Oscillospiraceae bacterium]|jgi:hypothetical protein|nr:hypothetical protein [Oscillospiraceae bacterium]